MALTTIILPAFILVVALYALFIDNHLIRLEHEKARLEQLPEAADRSGH
jgi:hypothetical protein